MLIAVENGVNSVLQQCKMLIWTCFFGGWWRRCPLRWPKKQSY